MRRYPSLITRSLIFTGEKGDKGFIGTTGPPGVMGDQVSLLQKYSGYAGLIHNAHLAKFQIISRISV